MKTPTEGQLHNRLALIADKSSQVPKVDMNDTQSGKEARMAKALAKRARRLAQAIKLQNQYN